MASILRNNIENYPMPDGDKYGNVILFLNFSVSYITYSPEH